MGQAKRRGTYEERKAQAIALARNVERAVAHQEITGPSLPLSDRLRRSRRSQLRAAMLAASVFGLR